MFLLQVALNITPTSSERLDNAGLAFLSLLNFNSKHECRNARQTVGPTMAASSALAAVRYLVGINWMPETGFSCDVVSALMWCQLLWRYVCGRNSLKPGPKCFLSREWLWGMKHKHYKYLVAEMSFTDGCWFFQF